MGPKIDRLNVGDRVQRVGFDKSYDPTGTIEAVETELGPCYASVRFDGNITGFCAQVLKEGLVKVDR